MCNSEDIGSSEFSNEHGEITLKRNAARILQ